MTKQIATKTALLAQLRVIVADIVAANEGKSVATLFFMIQQAAAKAGLPATKNTTYTYLYAAKAELAKKEVISESAMKTIVMTINLQTYNLVRSGVVDAKTAVAKLQAALAKKSVSVSEARLVALLAEKKPGVFA